MIKRIKDLQHAQPFVAYVIELTSGKRLEVDNPDLVSFVEVGPGLVAVWGMDGTLHTVSALHITRVGILGMAA